MAGRLDVIRQGAVMLSWRIDNVTHAQKENPAGFRLRGIFSSGFHHRGLVRGITLVERMVTERSEPSI